MKRIGLLHTVPSVLPSFEMSLRGAMPGDELEIHHTLDTFLATDAAVNGFTQENLNRLFFLLKALDLEHADVIVVTCSTLTPGVEKIRPFLTTPTVAIDDAMVSEVVRTAGKIMVMATATSTIEPTVQKIRAEAAGAGRALELDHIVCGDALMALKKQDMETHDRLLKELAGTVKDKEAIVLAQASMAHLEDAIRQISGVPTFSSPAMCIGQVKRILGFK